MTVYWRMVIQDVHGNLWFDLLPLDSGVSGSEIMHLARKKSVSMIDSQNSLFASLAYRFGSVKAERGILSPLSTRAFEAQQYPCTVFIEDRVVDPILSRAFHDPETFRSATNIREAFACFEEGHRGHEGAEATVLLISVDTARVTMFLAAVTILGVSLVVGVVVGSALKNSGLGVAVTACLFAAASMLCGIIAGTLRPIA